jgi:hypothetical protein
MIQTSGVEPGQPQEHVPIRWLCAAGAILHGRRTPVKGNDLMSLLEEPFDHVEAHLAQADVAEFHG